MQFSSFESSSTSGVHSDSGYPSRKSSLQPMNMDEDYYWDLHRKRPSTFSPAPTSPKRSHAAPHEENLQLNASEAGNSDSTRLSDVISQFMEVNQRSEGDKNDDPMLQRSTSTMPNEPQISSTGQDTISQQPGIVDGAYIQRIDNLMAKVRRLREASIRASLTVSARERSPFREGSPLAPSKSSSPLPRSPKDTPNSHVIEYESLSLEYRNTAERRQKTAVEQQRQPTISPRMMNLEYTEDVELPSVAEGQHHQIDPKTPGGYQYFGEVDFLGGMHCLPPRTESKNPNPPSSRPQPSIISRMNDKQASGIDSRPITTYSPSHDKAGLYNSVENLPVAEPFESDGGSKRQSNLIYSHTSPRDRDMTLGTEQSFRENRLQCPTCRKAVRTKSELKLVSIFYPTYQRINIHMKELLTHGLAENTRSGTESLSTVAFQVVLRQMGSAQPTT
jgi:hypothetical protein